MLALLLNWRVWAAIVLASSLVFAGIGGYKYGKNTVQQEFDAYKTTQVQQAFKQQELNTLKEQQLQDSTTKVTNDYSAKVTSTSSSIADLARLRHNLTASPSGVVPQASPASGVPDGDAKDWVLAECRDRRDELAGEAQQLSDQVSGLQSYIKGVTTNGS